jgi:hypothetical protein
LTTRSDNARRWPGPPPTASFNTVERQRRPAPEFEPPVEPGDGTSLRGLAAVARIVRGRELATDAVGVPPLDSDQVLDLQRTAGNRLTAGALARWIEALPQESLAQQLLEALFADAALHDTIAAALDGLDPVIEVHVDGPAQPTQLEVTGPRGGVARTVTPPATVELPFNALFGPAAAIGPHAALMIVCGDRTTELRVPFAETVDGVRANLR